MDDASISFGVPRSPDWPKVRGEFLKDHPVCECCGGSTMLNVHHIVPFHIDKSREEDKTNLITLCEGSNGLNCHLWAGHCGNWSAWNERVRKAAKYIGAMLKKRSGQPWKNG